ncbi:ATP-dependent RNA helicase DHX58-like [Liolophura sinensis]|uniref:ATP-dependent RNA helicase DHX58-like n=1 Tax=Liolophura sinensis TaxID=3198878 RepID=UPI0031585236
MASASGLTEKDKNIRDKVKVYRPLIEGIINPTQMLSSAEAVTLKHCLGDTSVQRIKRRQNNEGDMSAARLMFETMEKCEECGVWTAFDDLVQNAGYTRISLILREEPMENEENNKHLLKVMGPIVKHKIDPVVLLPQLLRDTLSPEDGQNVRAEARNKGPISATVLLFDLLLKSKTRNWFDDFMSALIENQQHNVADEIDPDYYQEWKKLRSEGSSCTSTGDESLESMSSQTSVKRVYENDEEQEMEISYDYQENNLNRDDLQSAKPLSKDVTGHTKTSSELLLNVGLETRDKQKCSVSGEWTPDANSDNTTPKQRVDDSNTMDLTSDGEENAEQEAELQLRDYQKELARAGLEGKNCVIVAPTGSGKTMVALKIIQKHFSRQDSGIRKVAFLVNNVGLASQQAAACKKILPSLRTKLMCGGNEEQLSLSMLLPMVDVFFMTAQILLDALRNRNQENISLSQFTLIVFDECHHTFKKHPFNGIMFSYMDQKLQEGGQTSPLPQVIGLTASMGVGKAKNTEQAKMHIQKLCANLDASQICTVQKAVGELADFVPVPDEDIKSVEGRREDKFADFIQSWMDSIEKKIKAKGSSSATLEDPPRGKRDSQEYKQWISKIRRDVAVVYDSDMRYYCMSCINFAQMCNDALMINQDVRTRDALEYLKNKVSEVDSSRVHAVEKELIKHFRDNLAYLDTVSSSPLADNPKLRELKKMILLAYKEKADSRGIIFVKTRDLVQALHRWMMETPDLKWLNPHKLVGQATQEEGGMTQNQQRDVLTYFKDGHHKILIATSVAEEGLDIQKCNLVIRYDYTTNEIAMVQARGRARAENSRYISVVTEGRGIAEKEQLNMMREVMMNKAIRELQTDIAINPGLFLQCIEALQKGSKMERDLAGKEFGGASFVEGDFVLRCLTCDQFACFNYDLRRFESTHHAVISEDFPAHCNVSLHPKPTPLNHNLSKTGKISCKNCGSDWGIIAIYHDKRLCVIKISSFVIEDFHKNRDICTKWRKVRFLVEELKPSDNERASRTSLAIGQKLASCGTRR